VGGQDETRARAVLIAMQERLAVGPHVALGVDASATAPQVRTAFLQLTKTYHPARFGYMSAELQKLANEVFLALRAAHDAVARPARARERSDRSGAYPGGVARASDRSGAYPTAVVRVSDRSGAYPAAMPRPGERSGGFPAVVPKAGERSGGFPAVVPKAGERSGALPAAVPKAGERSGLPPAIGSGPPSPIPTRPPSAGLAPATSRITPPPGVRVGVVRPVAGPGSPLAQPPQSAAQPPRAATRPTAAQAVRPATGPSIGSPTGGPRSDLIDMTTALEHLQRGQWESARALLTALAERVPELRRYRALIAYSRGREAQLAGRLDEARVELQDSLQIDPDLQLAKTALAELFTRRK